MSGAASEPGLRNATFPGITPDVTRLMFQRNKLKKKWLQGFLLRLTGAIIGIYIKNKFLV